MSQGCYCPQGRNQTEKGIDGKGDEMQCTGPFVGKIGAGGRNRTDTGWKPRGILSPVRLPVSPLRHGNKYKKNDSVCQSKLNLTRYFVLCYFEFSWGCSSAGRAPEWHSGGRRFDPVQLHQRKLQAGICIVPNFFIFQSFPNIAFQIIPKTKTIEQ
jgi:hypothetical protein